MSARLLFLVLFTTACASTGATFQSGVGDRMLLEPPYVAGRSIAEVAPAATVGVLPVHFQPGGGQPAIFDPKWGAGSPVKQLLKEMNGYLDSLVTASGSTPTRLITGLSPNRSLPLDLRTGTAPDVRFGCLTEGDLPGEDCAARGDSALGRGRQEMKLAVGRPSAEWIEWNAGIMDAAGVTYTIVLSLEVGQYLLEQRGLAGKKVVELGTDHVAELPWATSLETPVTVLQLTGALVGRDGRAVRIGAEGIVARRTGLLASSLGAQRLLSEEDVRAVRTTRRQDLPEQPLAWQEAMRQLVRQLTR